MRAIVTDSRQDMGDTIGGSSAKTGGNAVGNDLHSETTGKHGTVGSVATNI